MRYLIDTHALIWFVEGEQIPQKLIALIENVNTGVYVSVASIWEIAIKLNLRKFEINIDFADFPNLLKKFNIDLLPITFKHLEKLLTLPSFHRDPFERHIIAQAITEDVTLITKDKIFSSYPVKTIW